MIIAVDFDGTIVEHEYPRIGREIPFAIDVLKRIQKEQHQLILWTVREGKLLDDAIAFCSERGLEFYAVNQNYEKETSSHPRKLNADLFIDDRNLGGLPDWGLIYRLVKGGESSVRNFSGLLRELQDNPVKTKKNFFTRLGEAWDRARGHNY